MSKSVPNVRRSQRLKNKLTEDKQDMTSLKNAIEEAAPSTAPGPSVAKSKASDSKSKSRCSNCSKSNRSRKEQAKIEIEMKKKELLHKHQQEMLDLELEMKLAALTEEETTSEEESESVKSESVKERPNINEWVSGKCPWDRSKCHLQSSPVEIPKVVPNFNFSEQIASSQLAKILTRQSMPKELPPFGGNPIEWPNFIFQYRNTTAICGYSNEENHIRLQKCLKGHARKIVESLLILPQNVDRIIRILENRFGRPEHIIMMLLDKIRNFPNVKEDRLDMLIEFSDEIKNLVGIMEALNENEHLSNPILIQELLSKLSTNRRMNWIEHISSRALQKPKLIEFSLWLDQKASVACQIMLPKVTDIRSDNHKLKSRTSFKREVTMTTINRPGGNKNCLCCESDLHHLSKCTKFTSMNNNERWNFVRSKGICFSCLIPYHSLKQCKKIKICGQNNCKKPHNELLHENEVESFQNINQSSNETEVNCHISTDTSVLLKILPINISQGGKSLNTYALLDDASTVTLIDQDLADQLELDGPQHALCIQWTNNQVKEQEDSRIVTCNIKSPDNGKSFQLRRVRTIRGLSLPSQTVDMNQISSKYPYINNTIASMVNAKPRLLIGQDNWPLLVNRKFINGPWNGPALSKTLLGWVVHGNITTGSSFSSIVNHVCYISHGEKDELDIIHDLVKQQWQIDNFGLDKLTKSMSREDMRAQNILDRTMIRKGDRYETGLLWRNENVVLPESKSNAMKRLLSTERKMDKNLQFGQAYCNKMLDLEKKDYIKKLSKEEAEMKNDRLWYLPHFGVFNPNKPNKLRIVFDAASKSNGISLNDCLLTGPDLYNSLYNILLNFRIKKYAFTADIKEMFLQIKVREEDRCAQRFLWRGMKRNTYPDTYEIQVVFFGSTSGPCLAQEAKNRNAREFVEKFPEASKAIIEDHYMDDYLGNADTELEAIKLIQDIIHVHLQGGFTICNWISNSDSVLEDIDKELIASKEIVSDDNTEPRVERILGAWWNPLEDSFGFNTKFHKISKCIIENQKRPTKREVLKAIMSVFDPLGFLANFIINGKVLLQDIWRNKLHWDDEITDDLNEKWTLWIEDLKQIYNFKIPRQYFTLDRYTSTIQLHVFSDASDKCYATVAYLRIEGHGEIQTSFVSAKTRVAPLKQPISIPRLELQAALMGARLGHSLTTNLRLKISQTFYWTDSKTVLHWVRSEAHRFKVFVAQRIGEIHELTDTTQWRYVPSKLNVADEATKRTKPLEFTNGSTWLYGPQFLQQGMNDWPEESPKANVEHYEEVLEKKKDYVCYIMKKPIFIIPDPQRFSKWNRFRRATAWMIRYIGNCKKNEISGELSVSEIQKAETLLFKKVQTDSFSDEVMALNRNQPLNKSSRLYSFSCELDENGLIRLGGRLNNSWQTDEYFRKPIILDPKHKITKLIIQFYHEQVQHHGQEMVVNNLRQKFWILHMRQAVKDIWKTCQWCKNRKASPESPIMGQLPKCRLEPTVRCFIKTGIDYFGPIHVAVKRSREKRYGVIFTCMATRAIHLEIANDLSTNSFIHVLRQFGCRRGFPSEIYSDNGGNFRLADKELSEALKQLNQTEIKTFCTMKNIKWTFNPPLAPHWGGAWERLIQSVKKIMKEMLTSRCPQEYVLRTIFAEVENIVNSRPLTHVSLDTDDSEALTPNHFLIGRQYAALPCAVTEENDLNLLSKWRAAQKLTDFFWKRWTQEYLPYLVKRSKWYGDSRAIQKNDIVIIVDPSGPRNTWPKGRVLQIYPGKDGKVRVVDVKLANGTILRRPVTKLCILDAQKEES